MIDSTERKKLLPGWWPLLAFAVIYAGVMGVRTFVDFHEAQNLETYQQVQDDTTSDFRDFWFTARHFVEKNEISTEFGVHNYLPFFTIFMAPWGMMPLAWASALFTIFSVALMACIVVLIEMLLNQGLNPRPRRATLAALGLIIAYAHTSVSLGTVNIVLLFLVLLTWVLFEQKQEWVAGVSLGIATLVKVIPGLLILFFLLKGRWKTGLSALITVVVLGVGLPTATLGWAKTVESHKTFLDGAVKGHSAKAMIYGEPETKNKRSYSNNAVPMVLRHLLIKANCGKWGHEVYVNIADFKHRVVFGIYIAIMAIILATTVSATLFRKHPWPPATSEDITSIRAQFGMWCCLMLLASPLVWTHYFVLAYWPVAFLAHRAQMTEQERDASHHRAMTAVIVILVGVLLLTWREARAAGAQMASILVLWGILAWESSRKSPPSQKAMSSQKTM